MTKYIIVLGIGTLIFISTIINMIYSETTVKSENFKVGTIFELE